jgi:Skp family chaperone for outer membrane proteins
MKRIFIVAGFVLSTGASFMTYGQTRPVATGPATPKPAAPQPSPATTASIPATKIAVVDTSMFGDAKAGIKRYLNAVKGVQSEFQPKQGELVSLQTRIKAIADEITKLSGNSVVSQQTIQAKRDDAERLQRELKYKKDQADADFQKRYEAVVGPISADIGKALDQYAAQQGLTMILDISKLLPAVLSMNPAMDVTQAFISEYNSKNP